MPRTYIHGLILDLVFLQATPFFSYKMSLQFMNFISGETIRSRFLILKYIVREINSQANNTAHSKSISTCRRAGKLLSGTLLSDERIRPGRNTLP
jgi:hypothetical protein